MCVVLNDLSAVSMLGSVDAECIGDIGTVIVELKR